MKKNEAAKYLKFFDPSRREIINGDLRLPMYRKDGSPMGRFKPASVYGRAELRAFGAWGDKHDAGFWVDLGCPGADSGLPPELLAGMLAYFCRYQDDLELVAKNFDEIHIPTYLRAVVK